MTESEFLTGLSGHCLETRDHNRVRNIVADALSAYAGELRRAGRPDRASRLAGMAGKIRCGQCPSRAVESKCARDVAAVQARLVDGESIT